MNENLRKILQSQREQLAELEAVADSLETEGLSAENAHLREKTEALSRELEVEKFRASSLNDENNRLKNSLNGMMINEWTRITKSTQESINFYCQTAGVKADNKISRLNSKYKKVLGYLQSSADSDIAAAEPELKTRLEETQAYLDKTIAGLRENNKKREDEVTRALEVEIDELKGMSMPSWESLENRLKNFSMEMRFGGRISNIIGVLLILMGIVFGLQLDILPDELRGALAYVVGIVFLAGGEFLQRRYKNSPFFLGVTAGGIAILFASTALSYFTLGIISMIVALILCVITSAAAFWLAIRYSSRMIACFALIGGYMPIIALTDDTSPAFFTTLMAYFVLLTLWALILATQRKWPIVNGLSYALSTLSAIILAFGFTIVPIAISVAYLVALFLLYISMILAYPIVRAYKGDGEGKTYLTGLDVVILCCNTIINCLMLYGLLNYYYSPFEHNGLLAIGFFTVYFAGAKLVDRLLVDDERVSTLFYLIALTFAIIIIPMQFGLDWLLIGWFIQGVTLTVFGVMKKSKGYERSGWLLLLLSIFPFLLEIPQYYTNRFFAHYTFVTVGLIVVVAAYHFANRDDSLFKFSTEGETHLVIRYFVVIQTFVYMLFATSHLYGLAMQAWEWPRYWRYDSMIMVAFLYSIGIRHLRGIADHVIKIISMCICIGAILCILWLNTMAVPSVNALNIGILIIVNLFSAVVVWDVTRLLNKMIDSSKFTEWAPIITSVYIWFVINMILVVQFEYDLNSILISAIGMVAALLWIIFGFERRNGSMRLFGLIFSFLSLAKLFFIDLYFLPQEMRIVSYFIFGIIFMAISFVYQYFNRKLEGRV